MQGYEDGTFKPTRVINRAELLKILVKDRHLTLDLNKYKNCFPDVRDEWFAQYVCYAKAQGWVSGYLDGTFKPDRQISRVEGLKMLLESKNVTVAASVKKQPYTDIYLEAWYAPYVQAGKLKNLLEIYPTALVKFEPEKRLTRGEAAEWLYRVLVMTEQGVAVYTKEAPRAENQNSNDNVAVDENTNANSNENAPVEKAYLRLSVSPIQSQTYNRFGAKVLEFSLLTNRDNVAIGAVTFYPHFVRARVNDTTVNYFTGLVLYKDAETQAENKLGEVFRTYWDHLTEIPVANFVLPKDQVQKFVLVMDERYQTAPIDYSFSLTGVSFTGGEIEKVEGVPVEVMVNVE